MARVILSENITIRGARRALSRRNSPFALTLRHGKVFTYHKTPTVQPNTAAQLNARALLQQANVLAREDLLRPGRREYWTNRALSTGYKTAIGCARAHFISLLKKKTAANLPSPRKSSAPRLLPPSRPRRSYRKSPEITIVRQFSRLQVPLVLIV